MGPMHIPWSAVWDKNDFTVSAGVLYGTAVDNFEGGQLAVAHNEGDSVYELDEDLPRVGKKGFKFKYRLHDVNNKKDAPRRDVKIDTETVVS